jgi:hypothetical protein
MQNLVVTLLLVVTTGLFSNTYAQSSKVEGTFYYVAQGESENGNEITGTIKITKTDAEYKVVVSPDASQKTYLTNVKVENNILTGSMNMQGNQLELSMKVEKDNIMGIASLPDGAKVSFTATRI